MIEIDNEKLKQDFDSVRHQNEDILWVGRPAFIPYLLKGILGYFLFLLVVLIWYYSISHVKNDDGSNYWFSGLPMIFVLLSFLSRLLSYFTASYALTPKRILIRTGWFSVNFTSIDMNALLEKEVKVNFAEKIFNVGTIRFYSGKTKTDEGTTSKVYESWECIENPYEVFKKLDL